MPPGPEGPGSHLHRDAGTLGTPLSRPSAPRILPSWSPVPGDPPSPDAWDVGTLGTCGTGERGLLRPGFFKCREAPSPISMGTWVTRGTPLSWLPLPSLDAWDSGTQGTRGTGGWGHAWPGCWEHREALSQVSIGTQGHPRPGHQPQGPPRVLTRRTREHQGTVGTPSSWSSAPGDP